MSKEKGSGIRTEWDWDGKLQFVLLLLVCVCVFCKSAPNPIIDPRNYSASQSLLHCTNVSGLLTILDHSARSLLL